MRRKPRTEEENLPDALREESGIHQEREAISKEDARTGTHRESQAGADRERKDAPPPASKPTHP